MKNINLLTTILFIIFFTQFSNAQETEGQLIEEIIPAPSLENNLLGIPSEQPIAVYLPPSYINSDNNYPVVYFLPGFSTPIKYLTVYGVFQGFFLKESIDELIKENKINEMIVVIPNGLTFMLGSFYVNSPVTGNWEDFIVEDVVNFIDNNYRTISNADSRGIAGHSMGGYGALNLAMLHPDVFSVTYGLCPGLFDQNGLSDHSMFSDQSIVEQYITKQEELESMTDEEAIIEFISFICHDIVVINDYSRAFSYAYGAAFSPNPDKKAPFIDYPYYLSDEGIILDSTIWVNYNNGFGCLAEKVEKYRDNFLQLNAIFIDYGMNDYHEWIPEGCIYFSSLLEQAGIPHELIEFEGGHGDKVRERIEDYILPTFSNTLEFE